MIDIILETLLDGIKLVPFLFGAFLIIELLEHRFSKKSKNVIMKSGNIGPLVGSALGLFPQCGFSVMATNLYTTRIITLGTLISIYLSTSDEMLPILISQKADLSTIVTLLLIKFVIGMISGFVIDFVMRKSNQKRKINYEICDEEHCDCHNGGLIKSTIKHTLNTVLFILIVSFILNVLMEIVGEENLSKIFLKNSIYGPFVSSIVGLIPNCASSVMITELYLGGVISLGATISGLLTGSGVAILLLFKENKDIKENLMILGLLYGIGVVSGIIIEIIMLLI